MRGWLTCLLAIDSSTEAMCIALSRDGETLVFEGEGRLRWFEGNFQDYEKDKMRRLGQDSIIPHRVKYKKLTR